MKTEYLAQIPSSRWSRRWLGATLMMLLLTLYPAPDDALQVNPGGHMTPSVFFNGSQTGRVCTVLGVVRLLARIRSKCYQPNRSGV